MSRVTAEDVAKMTATERVDAIAKLSPQMAQIVEAARSDGMDDAHLLDHFRAARDMKVN